MEKEEMRGEPVVQHKNWSLYPLEKKDVLKIMEWRNAQMEVLRQWKPLTLYNQEEWWKKLSTDPTQVIFAIIYKNEREERELIGYCGLLNIDFRNRRAELSFLVEPSRAANHSLYEKDFCAVLQMLCQYGFESLNLNKIFTETFSFRKFHISILEKFGFKLEGRLREHQFERGKFWDSLIHSILLSDWRGKDESRG